MSDDLTNEQWVELLAPHDNWNERIILAIFAVFGYPVSYLDVGCGTGAMVNIARKIGIESYGVDKIPRPDTHIFRHDLNNFFSLAMHGISEKVALVTSFEVGEHIYPDRHDNFCDTIARPVPDRGMLIFTAASPGQAGEGHVGVKHAPYWRAKMHDRGLTYQSYLTSRLRAVLLSLESPLFWLPGNLQVFTR